MKRTVQATLTGFFLFYLAASAVADVLFPATHPTYYQESRTGVSVEGILSSEWGITRLSTIVGWAGVGYLRTRGMEWCGYEGALGIRLYPVSRRYNGLFAGMYVGSALMDPLISDRDARAGFGISLGAKVGYKICFEVTNTRRFAVEPYTSVSLSPLLDTGEGSQEHAFKHLFYTTGVRILLESLHSDR